MESDHEDILPVCKICNKEFKMFSGLLTHLTRISSCKEAYGEEYDRLQSNSKQAKRNKRKLKYENDRDKHLEKQRKYDRDNAEIINKKKRVRYKDNPEKKSKSVQLYRNKNRLKINEKDRNRKVQKRTQTRSRMTSADRILKFKNDIKDGPNYVCQCCKRSLFLSGVKLLSKKHVKSLEETCSDTLLSTVLNGKPLKQNLIMCHNCFFIVSKTQKMPRICEANGLQLDDIPPELKVGEIENQFFAKSLIFMKIKTLPCVPRMNAVFDRVINVPLTDDDIVSTVEKLPRLPEKAKVAIQLKRKMELKSVEASIYINPDKIRKAIQMLQSLENRFYHNVSIDESVLQQLEQIPKEQSLDEDMDENDIAENEEKHENLTSLTDCSTSLIPRNLAADVIVNDEQCIPMSSPDDAIRVAPGEGKFNSLDSNINLIAVF